MVRTGLAAGDDADDGHVTLVDGHGAPAAVQGEPGGKVGAVAAVLQQT